MYLRWPSAFGPLRVRFIRYAGFMWLPNPDVLPTDLGDELVLMDSASSVMFSLNAAGRLLWQALPAEVAQQDTRDLLQALAERGLVQQA